MKIFNKILLATDHAGFELKEKLKTYLVNNGYDVEDMGAHELHPDDDYPDYVSLAAKAVSENPKNIRAIILGYSGQGEAMYANRFKGVRTTVYYGGSEEVLMLSRQDNDANVLSLGAGFLTQDEAERAVIFWLESKFSGEERHTRRIQKLDQ